MSCSIFVLHYDGVCGFVFVLCACAGGSVRIFIIFGIGKGSVCSSGCASRDTGVSLFDVFALSLFCVCV